MAPPGRAREGPTGRGRSPRAGTAPWGAGPGRPGAWPGRSPPGPQSAPPGHGWDGRGQGGGQVQSTKEATAPRAPEALQHQQAQAAPAAVGAGRARAQGHAGQPTRGRPPGRVALARARDRGRQAAKENGKRVTALGPHGYSLDRRREAS
jgi:hypothetical protein